MLRILRAFVWMRWRVLVNSLERTGARDTLERFSLAVEQLGPIVAAALLIPSVLLMSALSAGGGYTLATGSATAIPVQILRFVALAVLVLSILGPILLPVSERTNAVRLLLLPIPRATLYMTQAAGALGDPWIVLLLPVLIFLPAGLAAGGAAFGAIVALVAGLLFFAVAIGMSMLTANLVQLVARDRRRGELLALLFVLIIPMTSLIIGSFDPENRRPSRTGQSASQSHVVRDRIALAGRQAFAFVPSELLVSATRSGVARQAAASGAATLMLAAAALLVHGIGVIVFRALLDSPGNVGPRRTARASSAWATTLPGLSSAASAVAMAQLRLALRTPRGRSTLLSPLIAFAMFAVMVHRNRGDVSALSFRGGIGLAAFGSFISLLSILPLALNQFAIDGAGLTLAFLSPLDEREMLTGKAVANGMLAAAPAALCITVAFVLFPGGPLALWLSIPLALIATYLLAAPAAAAVSAIFPRAVDLNSIGRGSNAHGAAGLLGIAIFAVAGVPPAALILISTFLLDRPALAPILVGAWGVIAFVLCRVLFVVVRRIVTARRENLSLVAG
jgi:hypothetical protein